MDEPDRIISQPLLTDEGFINTAAMNELGAAIRDTPSDHVRLAGDPEWSEQHWISREHIVGNVAKWAVIQSPYAVPDNLEVVLKYLDACLMKSMFWTADGLNKLSLIEISKLLHDILDDMEAFKLWNRAKVGPTEEIKFVTMYDGRRNPDTDFIDTDALIHNVCMDLEHDNRRNAEFDRRFELECGSDYGLL